MTSEILQQKTKEEVLSYVRDRLKFDHNFLSQIRSLNYDDYKKEHRRFEMSGYDGGEIGSCTVHNQAILNEFADLGIYDYTKYLFLDFYKGSPILYLEYWNEAGSLEIDNLSGLTTSEIIYEIFKLTIFSGKGTRRRG